MTQMDSWNEDLFFLQLLLPSLNLKLERALFIFTLKSVQDWGFDWILYTSEIIIYARYKIIITCAY